LNGWRRRLSQEKLRSRHLGIEHPEPRGEVRPDWRYDMDALSTFADDYWLRRCEGFRVESPDGFVGWVEEVWLGAEHEPEVLVLQGPQGRRLLSLAGEDVRVDPRRERIVLDSTPELISPKDAWDPRAAAGRADAPMHEVARGPGVGLPRAGL
jgi:hypothetical protein